jgi:hypothetical protein
VPDDLLRFVSGPSPYSGWWLAAAALLTLLVIGWYAGVFVFTRPGRRVGDIPLVAATRHELLRRRYIRAVRAVEARYRSRELAAAPAATAVSRELRTFLHRVSGAPAEYMQIEAIAAGPLAPAAPVLADLADAQFNADSTRDVGALTDTVVELIRSWS